MGAVGAFASARAYARLFILYNFSYCKKYRKRNNDNNYLVKQGLVFYQFAWYNLVLLKFNGVGYFGVTVQIRIYANDNVAAFSARYARS